MQHAVPNSNDTLWFNGNPGPGIDAAKANQSTSFPDTTGQADNVYDGIVFENGFTGTVGFSSSVSFNNYAQTCGKTECELVGTTINVSNSFVWTGGSTCYETPGATFVLSGVQNGQIGLDTSTLNTGAKFVLQSRNEFTPGDGATPGR